MLPGGRRSGVLGVPRKILPPPAGVAVGVAVVAASVSAADSVVAVYVAAVAAAAVSAAVGCTADAAAAVAHAFLGLAPPGGRGFPSKRGACLPIAVLPGVEEGCFCFGAERARGEGVEGVYSVCGWP